MNKCTCIIVDSYGNGLIWPDIIITENSPNLSETDVNRVIAVGKNTGVKGFVDMT